MTILTVCSAHFPVSYSNYSVSQIRLMAVAHILFDESPCQLSMPLSVTVGLMAVLTPCLKHISRSAVSTVQCFFWT